MIQTYENHPIHSYQDTTGLEEWRSKIGADYWTIVSICFFLLGSDNLLLVVKRVKQITGLGLRECKDLAESYLAAHNTETQDVKGEFYRIFRKKELKYVFKSNITEKDGVY